MSPQSFVKQRRELSPVRGKEALGNKKDNIKEKRKKHEEGGENSYNSALTLENEKPLDRPSAKSSIGIRPIKIKPFLLKKKLLMIEKYGFETPVKKTFINKSSQDIIE